MYYYYESYQACMKLLLGMEIDEHYRAGKTLIMKWRDDARWRRKKPKQLSPLSRHTQWACV